MPTTLEQPAPKESPTDLSAVLGPESDLPRIQDHPDREAVIFDGKCRFCHKQVARLARWDNGRRLAFVSLHDPWVAENVPELTYDQLMDEMFVIDKQGKPRGGAAAFRYLTRRLSRLWILAPLLHVPFSLPLWRWGYRQIAKRRYKISQKMGGGCDGDSCSLHFD